MSKKQRLVSGIQPTGKMHLGNYLGAVQNWVQLQDQYDPIYLIVDLHSLTTVYEDPAKLRQDRHELAIDLLASGIDFEKSILAYQSDIVGHSELHLILSMITPLPWLQRVPSYKGKQEEIKEKDLNTYGFLGYPVLQAADIMLYKGDVVPVGHDQLPHLELAREITRRFNHLYKNVFPEPQDMLTQFAAIPGLDGRKMSKSYNNTIPLSADEDTTQKLVMKMMTDPNRKLRTDPGNPEICPVFQFHKIFNEATNCNTIAERCKSAEIGCVDCKKDCAGRINDNLRAIRTKRSELEKHGPDVEKSLKLSAEKARAIADETMKEVKQVVGL